MPAREDPLNAPTAAQRLSALRGLPAEPRDARPTGEVNNHVHTTYSFSPYSPAKAVERARHAGLLAVGIVDHDTLAGSAEMREAGKILGIATTTGVELRVSAAGTFLEGRKINNPDSPGIMYMMMHGVPHRNIPLIEGLLAPVRASRERRSRRMVEELNALLPGLGLDPLDFDSDVHAASQAVDGGTITERHILFALSGRIVQAAGRGDGLSRFLGDRLGVEIAGRLETYILDTDNPFIHYDLLGLLKSSFLPRIFIQPDADECVPVRSAVKLAEEADAIPCYGYLGDVVDSPTGDKKAEKFEDGYLDSLMAEVKRLGFRAVTYMPPRNTMEQLSRVRALCAVHGLMEISGVDINSPRQSFRCPEILLPEFSHLMASTWALIAHENLADVEDRNGLFRPDNPLAGLPLAERIRRYAAVGASMDPARPDQAVEQPL